MPGKLPWLGYIDDWFIVSWLQKTVPCGAQAEKVGRVLQTNCCGWPGGAEEGTMRLERGLRGRNQGLAPSGLGVTVNSEPGRELLVSCFRKTSAFKIASGS